MRGHPRGCGSRTPSGWRSSASGDHPRTCGAQNLFGLRGARVRGEQRSAGPRYYSVSGSSPRVRGADLRPKLQREARGTIPAGCEEQLPNLVDVLADRGAIPASVGSKNRPV